MPCPRCGYRGPSVIYDANGPGVWCGRCRFELSPSAGSAVPALLVLATAFALAGWFAWMVLFQ